MVQFGDYYFNFDSISFMIGFGAGVGTTIAGYRTLRYIQELQGRGPKAVQRTFATREADRGYLVSLVEYAQHAHLFGHKTRLIDMLVEPRFLRPPDLVEIPNEDEANDDVFRTVPRVHDYPFLHAPYNIPTISIDDLSRGNNAIALVGIQGSGRTTALLAIALWSAGFVEFEKPEDSVSQKLSEEEGDLSARDRAERVKKRVAMSERARARYLDQIGEKSGDPDREKGESKFGHADESGSRFRQIAPIYVHLANVILDSGEYGQNIDPAEPLVRALQQQAGWLASKRLVGKTYSLLEAGSGLVMIDGYDDIPHRDRPAALRWIKALMTMYPDNFYIVTMPPEGYGLLMEVGAVPVFLRPWSDQSIHDATEKWREKWEDISNKAIQHDPELYTNIDVFHRAVEMNARQFHAFDTTLRIWSEFSNASGNQSEQMSAYLSALLPDVDNLRLELEQMAIMQLDEGYITLNRLVDLVLKRETGDRVKTKLGDTGKLVPKTGNLEQLAIFDDMEEESAPASDMDSFIDEADNLSEFLGGIEHTSPEDIAAPITDSSIKSSTKAEEKEIEAERKRIAREQGRLLDKLVKAEILVQYRKGRYQFRHPIVTAFLGALALHEADEAVVLEKYHKPDWEYAFNYLAQIRDVDFLVAEQLSKPLDVLHENILKLSTWLKFAGSEVEWRNNLLKYFGTLMIAPNQFSLVRERVAAALVNSKEEGAIVIFRRAVQSQNPDSRRVGCLGLGALRDEGALDALTQVAMQDPNVDTLTAATLALAAVGTDEAFETLIDLLEMSGDKDIRRAIAESLAANRQFGYITLYEALESDDMMLRRAAVFGLGRIGTDWALIALNETFLEDAEWYVRSAAQVVFQQVYEDSLRGVKRYPDIPNVPWLKQWGQTMMNEGFIPYDTQIEDVFEEAINQTEDPLIRLMATATIGQIGHYPMLDKVYQALKDDQEAIRDTAYRTLGELQLQLGRPLPAPTA
jgi:hypothetical protein